MKLDSVFSTKHGLVIGLVVTSVFAFIARYMSIETVNKNELCFYEEKTKEQLPMALGNTGLINFLYFTNDELVYICDVDENTESIAGLKSDLKQTRNLCMLSLFLQKERANALFSLLAKYNKGLKVIYKGRNDSVAIKFHPEEIKDFALQKNETKKFALENIEYYINKQNALCPIKSSDTLTLVLLKLDKTSLFYYYTIDEGQGFSINSLKVDSTHSELFPVLNNRAVRPECLKAAVAGLGIKFVFTSAQTAQQKVFTLNNDELVGLLLNQTKRK
ncbi:MAG: hypothetical protein IKP81_12495 [Paludibacteraceae bacterium]|nr:hypothetical protein [Paludibacteraceae bacterium]MBR6105861.1 hypothetical protein [Paludibacteraceae bacterium]